jgi:lysophospholipase L1-like esterase
MIDSLARTLAVRAIGATPRGATSVVILGDSITEQLGYHNQIARQFDISYFAWANALLGGRLMLLNNAGLGSTSTTFDPASSPPGMGVRLQSEVIAYRPDWCFLLGGANDVNATGVDSAIIADTIANLTEIIRRCTAAGIRVGIGTITPTMTTNPYWSAARVYRANRINAWIRSLPGRWPGLVLFDFAAAAIDPVNANGQPRAGYLQADDGIHPSQLGAYWYGRVLADALATIVPLAACLPSSVTDQASFYAGGPSDQLFARPLFTVPTGGINSAGATVTGDVPGTMSLLKSGTWGTGFASSSAVAREDGFGNDWQLIVTNAGADNDYLAMTSPSFHAAVAPGDVLVGVAGFSASGLTAYRGAGLLIEGTDSANAFTRASALERGVTDDPAATADRFVNVDHALTLRTGPYVVPPGLTSLKLSLRPRWGVGGRGTIRWGRVAVWRVPAYPAAA